MNERQQVMEFLFQTIDQKNVIIQQLSDKIKELEAKQAQEAAASEPPKAKPAK